MNAGGLLPVCLAVLLSEYSIHAQWQENWSRVADSSKVSQSRGGFGGALEDEVFFGRSVTTIGDLNGDGVPDLAVGAYVDPDGGLSHGAVWILFMAADGTVIDQTKISDTQGGFQGQLHDGTRFGISVACLGDLDGDCVPDLAVGANGDIQGCAAFLCSTGAAWILFLNPDGTVKREQKIVYAQDDPFTAFGSSMSCIGDLDGDGIQDLCVGAPGFSDGGEHRGAAWILFLQRDGTPKHVQIISDTRGNFGGTLVNFDNFGYGVSSLGDLDQDGLPELAVSGLNGAIDYRGKLWILSLGADGNVRWSHRLTPAKGWDAPLDVGDVAVIVEGLGDVTGDGVGDLAVGAPGDDDGGQDRGAVWLLAMERDGTVKTIKKLSDLNVDFRGGLDYRDWFGGSVSRLGDLDADGFDDIAVGAWKDDDGGLDRGALWVLFMGEDKLSPTGPPQGGGSVIVPLRSAPQCLFTQPRLQLRAGHHVAQGSIPVLWLTPPGAHPRSLGVPRLASLRGTALFGPPVADGLYRFALPASVSCPEVECQGFYLTPRGERVSASLQLIEPTLPW